MTEKNWQGKTVLMMAGGTGGHVFPALAVANVLRAKGADVHWLGSEKGFEGQKIPAAGFPFHDIAVRGLRGTGVLGWLNAPFMVTKATWHAKQILESVKPDLVIGMGGFAAAPGGLAAYQMSIPLVIHEQNAIAGLTNRQLSRFATKVLLGDERAAEKMHAKDYVVTGNPVREEISATAIPPRRFLGRRGAIRLLLIGGSQGAKALNELLPKALALLPENQRPEVTHQVGERWLEQTEALYQAHGVRAQIVPFIDNMAQAYGNCDWLIARSGALTVAEVSTVGISTLFVPFPYAVDDHQTANAQQLVSAHAAEVIQQADLTAERLAQAIAARTDRGELLKQAERARSHSHAKALSKIIGEIETIL